MGEEGRGAGDESGRRTWWRRVVEGEGLGGEECRRVVEGERDGGTWLGKRKEMVDEEKTCVVEVLREEGAGLIR